ncbi:HPr(Ser) kinase/phosphatase [Haloplasma contractile]|uniref:HPr(Ser) kinase/phosphatase n=1 Tax=Haloplasma contractile TaxID=471825 RepID=UPI00068498A2
MLKVRELVEELKFTIIAGEAGLDRRIDQKMLSRPGLELAGLFDFYEEDRIQIIGSKEVTFFYWLNEQDQDIRVEMLFREKTPAFIFSNDFDIPEVFIRNANKYKIPVLRSSKKTTPLMGDVTNFLQEKLADFTSVHGVLIDVHGVGTLIRGGSGIGKSETALELVKRGHKLVADDNVEIYEKEPGLIVGKPPKILEKVMEIRGIGIINVVQMFGAGSFRHKKRITLVIDLEKDEGKGNNYDRLGVEELTLKILNTEVAHIRIPVRPGRNVSSLIEVAAINRKLRYMGYNAAKEFTDNLDQLILENAQNNNNNN